MTKNLNELLYDMILSLSKKVYPSLIAESIVGVQPMTAPTYLTYYIRHKFASDDCPLEKMKYQLGLLMGNINKLINSNPLT